MDIENLSETNSRRSQQRQLQQGQDDRGTWSVLLARLWSWFPYKDSFVVAPALSMILNVILASTLSLVTTTDNPELAAKGLQMLGLVSSASISIVTLTFSLTVLSVQLASQSYSPRLLDDFIKDPVPKVVMSVNLGAFAFCYTSLYFIDDSDVAFPRVPYITINCLTVHAALILITFVNFVHFFINGMRVEKILAKASHSSLQAARALSAALNTELNEEIQVPLRARKVMARTSGYASRFTLKALVDTAEKLDICIRYNIQAGEFVNQGTVMCYVWELKTRDCSKNLEERFLDILPLANDERDCSSSDQQVQCRLELFCARGIEISTRRSSDYDVTLGIQQLSDIAVRALSPGINDPHTAIQCMDVLEPLLAKLGVMPLGVPHAPDDDGNIRICAPRRSFSHLCSMLDGIRVYGENDLTICRRGLRLFGDLAFMLSRTDFMDRLSIVLDQLEQWMKTSKKNFEAGSPEMESLQALYEHLLRTIAESESVFLKNENDEVRDLQAFETTYKSQDEDEADEFSTVAMDFLRKWTTSTPTAEDVRKKTKQK